MKFLFRLVQQQKLSRTQLGLVLTELQAWAFGVVHNSAKLPCVQSRLVYSDSFYRLVPC